MCRVCCRIFLFLFLIRDAAFGYGIIEPQIDFLYTIEAHVELVPDILTDNVADSITQWNLNSSLKVQRIDDDTIAMQLLIADDHDEQLKPLAAPFKLISLNESSMYHPQKAIALLPEREEIWSANIKRAILSLFQIEGNSDIGAFVSNEFGLSGLCPMEYYVVNSSDSLVISKIYDMDRCTIPGGIFRVRSNIPLNFCEIEKNKAAHAVTSRLGNYVLKKLNNSKYVLQSIQAESKSNVQASESYYPQFIFTKIHISLASQSALTGESSIKFNESEKMVLSDFTYVVPVEEATGGRNKKSSEEVSQVVEAMLKTLAHNLHDKNINFEEPYVENISEIFRLLETMNLQSLRQLYDRIDIGTSYTQETSRNIFLEILPRVGTQSSVLLTKHLVVENKVRSTTAVQLLTALPFFISELSAELVRDCEDLLHVGVDRPDVRHSAVLSYSTMINKAYVAGVITNAQFEKYVKIIFDLFLSSFDYEMQMLYLEAMGNLQLGNVNNYLQPIIQADYSQTTDIRFLSIFATMPTAHTRPAEIFETYWPIFHTKTTPLQLRIAAFTMLFVSAQTPGRLLGLFNVIKNENCPHMINFYRTTVLSISESTYSCLSHLKRLVLYMRRHLPPSPPKKYWITGNYIFDYKDRKFQIGSMLQVLLIGDRKKDLPLIAFMKFDTEAMGRFTGQLGLYIKARGLTDAVLERLNNINAATVRVEELSRILKMMKMQPTELTTPLHLELIVQYEGKTILSYYLNRTTFHNLTDGNIINRINAILRTDSHINMQLIRRPFVIKHSLSTLIGTPASILIENTMIASVRGSTTQSIAMDQIMRNNQVDLRYSSYAVAKILSYNPVADIEFSTIREQGFFLYLPINNEIKLNILDKTISLTFYRKEISTSGVALKSRTRSFCGVKENRKELHGAPTVQFNIADIGLRFAIIHNVDKSRENLIFLFESDVATSAKVFTRTPYSFIQNILTLISMIQLISIHIAKDKHFTVLLTNDEPKSKLVINLKYGSEDPRASTDEERVIKIDCNLLHILNYDDDAQSKQLHKWEFSTKYTTFINTKASEAVISFNRHSSVDRGHGHAWRVCVTSAFESLAHFKRPLNFTSKILFGDIDDTLQSCPVNKSRIDVALAVGSPAQANFAFNSINVADEGCCTKDIIKFRPFPHFENCNASAFTDALLINNLKLHVDFFKMPSRFYDAVSRLDHIISAAVLRNVAKLNMTDYIRLDIKLPTYDSEWLEVKINENSISIPFGYQFQHGSLDQALVDYSFTSVCSLYKSTINTFSGNDVNLMEPLTGSYSNNGEMLLVAECIETPRLAVFIKYSNNSSDFSHLKVYVGGENYMLIGAEGKPIIYYDDKRYDLTESNFEFPSLEGGDFRVLLNDDDHVIEIENDIFKAKIMYNMRNLISVSLPTIMKGKLCGLCTTNSNKIC